MLAVFFVLTLSFLVGREVEARDAVYVTLLFDQREISECHRRLCLYFSSASQSSLAKNNLIMKWNIGSSSASTQVPVDHTAATSIPSDHPHIPISSSSRPPPQCPMHQADVPPAPSTANAPAKCPIQHDALDPTTHMPVNLSLSRQPDQKLDLPTERTASTIPRPSAAPGGEAYGTGNTWDYPSPQQFYNALVRKGWETPEDSVEVMVAIHNFLNERAWDEVMKWEKRLPGGDQSQLARFQGRPGELSPKARFHLWAGKLFPSKFKYVCFFFFPTYLPKCSMLTNVV